LHNSEPENDDGIKGDGTDGWGRLRQVLKDVTCKEDTGQLDEVWAMSGSAIDEGGSERGK
jgi:hypothetical protein